MGVHRYGVSIVQPSPAQLTVVNRKAEWLYKVQFTTGVSAQPDDIARIGRDLGLVKNHMKHISSASGGFEDRQQNGSDENQYRKLIEPAVKNMAMTVRIITKPFDQEAAPEVVDHQDNHQNKFGRKPDLASPYAVTQP
jgi:hypothetical protein